MYVINIFTPVESTKTTTLCPGLLCLPGAHPVQRGHQWGCPAAHKRHMQVQPPCSAMSAMPMLTEVLRTSGLLHEIAGFLCKPCTKHMLLCAWQCSHSHVDSCGVLRQQQTRRQPFISGASSRQSPIYCKVLAHRMLHPASKSSKLEKHYACLAAKPELTMLRCTAQRRVPIMQIEVVDMLTGSHMCKKLTEKQASLAAADYTRAADEQLYRAAILPHCPAGQLAEEPPGGRCLPHFHLKMRCNQSATYTSARSAGTSIPAGPLSAGQKAQTTRLIRNPIPYTSRSKQSRRQCNNTPA